MAHIRLFHGVGAANAVMNSTNKETTKMRVKHLRGWRIVALLTVSSLGLSAAAWAQAGAASREVPLVEAVKMADTAAVRALLEQQVDVNTPEVDGTTALHWAAHLGDRNTAELLIQAGATVQAANRYGVTPLSLACMSMHSAVVESLLNAGADPNSASPEGQTALMSAARAGNVGAIKLLLAHGADVDTKESYRGQTALMWAAAQDHATAIQAILEAGADIHARSKGKPRGIRAALRRGVSQFDVNAGVASTGNLEETVDVAPSGFTPLLFAVRAGAIDATRVLLEAGGNANDKVGADGTAALVLAVINANYELAQVLLENGADPNADTQGWTALHQLMWTRKPNVLRPLPFPLASGNLSDLDLAKVLVAHGADPNARQTAEPSDGNRNVLNRIGSTPFLLAAKAGDAEMMRVLMDLGADPLLATLEGATPLMAAAGVGIWRIGENVGTNEEALEAVMLAWELGGDVNAIDANGDTALHGSVHRGANAIVQFLMDKGADPDVVNRFGWTPLTIAEGVWYPNTYKSEPETGTLLVQLGAVNPGTRRIEDFPPTEIAAPVEGGVLGGGQEVLREQREAQQQQQ